VWHQEGSPATNETSEAQIFSQNAAVLAVQQGSLLTE